MPIRMSSDTAALFASHANKFDSRSLLLDRFVYDLQEPKMDEARRLHFARVCEDSFAFIQATRAKWQKELTETRKEKEREKLTAFLDDTAAMAKRTFVVGPAQAQEVTQSRQSFYKTVATGDPLHAQLRSRLMVNMAGGVMENAGLCLDRFGLPYIPGSAVKGCARRAALAALHDWFCAGGQPTNKPTDQNNPLAQCCAPFATAQEMLAAIARVFGWGDLDWSSKKKDGRFISDFAYACGAADWEEIRDRVAKLLFAAFPNWKADPKRPLWESIPNFAGSISFLPAYPVDLGKTGKVDGLPLDVPALGKLELDVVTCHHRDYYASNDPNAVATDTEEPNPVVFPAVAPGHVFTFALVLPLRGADQNLLERARTWLKTGLETFGLGAKTNAGYGWFDASDAVQDAVRNALVEQAKRQKQEQQRRAEEERRKAEEEERRRKAEAAKAATKDMTPEQKADYELAQLTPDQFRGRLDSFSKREKLEQEAMVRAMRLPPDAPGSRRQFWEELKQKAQKGGKPAQIEQAIRQLCKQMNLGKMP